MTARDNPFATGRVLRIRYRPQHEDWDSLVGRLQTLGCRASIVGPHGSGKTTLMEDLTERLAALGYETRLLRLSSTVRRIPRPLLARALANLNPRICICLDGAEQLSRLQWTWFRLRTRNAGGLLITSHRSGLLPTLIECRTSAALLGEIVGELTPTRVVNGSQTSALFERHNGNIREALRELYDVYAAS